MTARDRDSVLPALARASLSAACSSCSRDEKGVSVRNFCTVTARLRLRIPHLRIYAFTFARSPTPQGWFRSNGDLSAPSARCTRETAAPDLVIEAVELVNESYRPVQPNRG